MDMHEKEPFSLLEQVIHELKEISIPFDILSDAIQWNIRFKNESIIHRETRNAILDQKIIGVQKNIEELNHADGILSLQAKGNCVTINEIIRHQLHSYNALIASQLAEHIMETASEHYVATHPDIDAQLLSDALHEIESPSENTGGNFDDDRPGLDAFLFARLYEDGTYNKLTESLTRTEA